MYQEVIEAFEADSRELTVRQALRLIRKLLRKARG